jgi:hypothetical protein
MIARSRLQFACLAFLIPCCKYETIWLLPVNSFLANQAQGSVQFKLAESF